MFGNDHRCVVLPACTTFFSGGAVGQEKSLKPGINKFFQDPKPATFVERFEREGREIYDLKEKIVERCRLEKGLTVADIGAGTGLFTRLFAKTVGATGTVYAKRTTTEFGKITIQKEGYKPIPAGRHATFGAAGEDPERELSPAPGPLPARTPSSVIPLVAEQAYERPPYHVDGPR